MAAGLLLSVDATARDQLQGVFEGAAGYTDNVFSSPNEPVPDVRPKEGDAMLVLSPAIVFASATAPSSHKLSYTTTGTFFLTTSRRSIANRAEYNGLFDLSPAIDLTLAGGATQNQYDTSNTFISSTATTLSALIPGVNTYVLLHADEGLQFELSRDLRAYQSTGVGYQTPLFVDARTTTLRLRNRAGIDYVWPTDSLGPEGRFDYSHITNALNSDGQYIGDQRVFIAGGDLRWRHDWGRYFTSRVEAGAVHVALPDSDATDDHLIGGAYLFYFRYPGEVELFYDRNVTTRLLLGQTYLIDQVRLRGAIPVDDDEEIWVAASAGYQHGRLLDPDGSLATPVDVLLGDVSVVWRATDQLAFSARYQHVQQKTDAELPPLPLSFTRNIAMLSARFTIPEDQDMPAQYRTPERVDMTDEIRPGNDAPTDDGGFFQ